MRCCSCSALDQSSRTQQCAHHSDGVPPLVLQGVEGSRGGLDSYEERQGCHPPEGCAAGEYNLQVSGFVRWGKGEDVWRALCIGDEVGLHHLILSYARVARFIGLENFEDGVLHDELHRTGVGVYMRVCIHICVSL